MQTAMTCNPAYIYLFKVNNRNTRKKCEIYLKLTTKAPERRKSDVFIVNFEHISHLFLVFLLLTLNKQMLARKVSNDLFYWANLFLQTL